MLLAWLSLFGHALVLARRIRNLGQRCILSDTCSKPTLLGFTMLATSLGTELVSGAVQSKSTIDVDCLKTSNVTFLPQQNPSVTTVHATGNQVNMWQVWVCPYGPHASSFFVELTVRHLRYHRKDVSPRHTCCLTATFEADEPTALTIQS